MSDNKALVPWLARRVRTFSLSVGRHRNEYSEVNSPAKRTKKWISVCESKQKSSLLELRHQFLKAFCSLSLSFSITLATQTKLAQGFSRHSREIDTRNPKIFSKLLTFRNVIDLTSRHFWGKSFPRGWHVSFSSVLRSYHTYRHGNSHRSQTTSGLID